MKTTCASLLILAASLAAASAQTNAPAVRAMSLPDCLAEALRHNFDVQVERYEPEKSLLNLNAAYAGYDPTFSLSGTHSHSNLGMETGAFGAVPIISDGNSFNSGLTGSLPWGMTYGLTGNVAENYGQSYPSITSPGIYDSSSGRVGVNGRQPLLKNFWIDGTRLLISAAKNNLKLSEQGLRQQLITTVTAVENAYYELIYARENLKVQQQALALAEKQLADDKSRVNIGTVAAAGGTIEQDEAQVAQNHANLIAAQFTLASDENALKDLITDNYRQWHDTAIEPAATLEAVRQMFDVQDSWSKGMAQRPDLLQAKLNVEQQGIQLKYDRNQLFPQLDLTGSYGYNGAGREFNDAFGQYAKANQPYYTYGAELSLPLSNAKSRNSLKADKAVEQQLLLKLKQLEQSVMVQIDNGVKQAQSAWESVDATQKARTYAEAALKAEQGKYAVGKSTTFTVLQLQNNLTAARSQEIRALANYNEALANLARQEGTTLERRKVDLRVR
ncbi:MAG: TolC family protein [Verrucomicrobiota bacterium]